MPELPVDCRCLIFGCGALGSRVARRWHDAGARVTIVTRSAAKAEQFRRQGYQPLVADITRPETLTELPTAKIILYCVGFDRSAGNTIHQVYAGGMRHVLSRSPSPATARLIYVSTTGVYAPVPGPAAQQAWVDEQWPTRPQRSGAKASLAAEQQLTGHPLGKRAIILRMAGLYGPGRISYQEKIRAGQPLAVPPESWLNLIHMDDAAAVVLAAGNWSGGNCQGPEIFNVADGNPVLRGEYYREVARRLDAPEPQFITPNANHPATTRAATNKRICNLKLFQTLAIKLSFPTYREGLAAILPQQQ